MSDTIHLIGAEQVQQAAHRMSHAADEMQRAASAIAESNERQRQFLDDWLQRLAGTFEDHITMLRQS